MRSRGSNSISCFQLLAMSFPNLGKSVAHMGPWSNFTPILGAHCFEGMNCQASNPVKD